MEVEQRIRCDDCGATWFYEDGRRNLWCPECREIWHKAGQSFTGFVFIFKR